MKTKALLLTLALGLAAVAASARTPVMTCAADVSAAALEVAPAPEAAPSLEYTDADFSPWEDYGQVHVQCSDPIADYFNNLRAEGEAPCHADSDHYTQAYVRHLLSDPEVLQFKIAGFMDCADVLLTLDPVSYFMTMERTPTNLPVYNYLKDEFNTEIINLWCENVSYSPLVCYIRFSGLFFEVQDGWGYKTNVTVTLPGTPATIGMNVDRGANPGHSTRVYDEFDVSLIGIDHIKYYVTTGSFTVEHLRKCITGEINTAVTSEKIYVAYTEGAGTYKVWVLCFDANDRYMGVYHGFQAISNRAPEGQWEYVGKAVWHHPWRDRYEVWNRDEDSGEYTYDEIVLPEDKLKWEVNLERRIDLDSLNEEYRLVNVYGEGCPLNEIWTELMNRVYGEGNWGPYLYNPFDDYWFVIRLYYTVGNIEIPSRPTGAMNTHFISGSYPDYYSFLSFDNNILKANAPYTFDTLLTVEFPDLGGIDAPTVGGSDPVEYYNLQGMRVDNPSGGIFIRRQGDRTEKVRL